MNEREELAAIVRSVLLNPPDRMFVDDAIADAIQEAGFVKEDCCCGNCGL